MNTAVDYSEKLKDPLWQKKRLFALERANWKCELCRDEKSTLHVHHLEYRQGREPWEYGDKELMALCEGCHESIHAANLTGAVLRLLKFQFRRGEIYAITALAEGEGSPERIKYLEEVLTTGA